MGLSRLLLFILIIIVADAIKNPNKLGTTDIIFCKILFIYKSSIIEIIKNIKVRIIGKKYFNIGAKVFSPELNISSCLFHSFLNLSRYK